MSEWLSDDCLRDMGIDEHLFEPFRDAVRAFSESWAKEPSE